MLREIHAARQNNTASHMMSNSELTLRKMPPEKALLSELDGLRQSDTDHRTAGIDTSQSNMIDFRA